MPGLSRCTRSQIRHNSLHASTRLGGLRLINNNYTSDGSGRDWQIFGDPGFDGGRVTPRGPDTKLPPQGDRPTVRGLVKQATSDGRRPTVAVPRSKDGSAQKPLPSVVQRWHRVASTPCALDTMARIGDRSAEQKDDLPMAHYLSAEEQAMLDTKFKPNMATYPFQKQPPPVDKYHYFAEMKVIDARRPEAEIKKLGPETSTYTRQAIGKLDNPVICKHHWFSENTVRNSPHFQTLSAQDGLAKPRRAFSTPAGQLTASLAALPKRMDLRQAFPFGAG